jgi:RNA polymerase subunit RPABC4/transcription elongation factor Spt4
MALVQFVHNYDDLSTDRGYQFKFHCDKCGNGFMSRFQASTIGTAGAVLRSVGNIFGGWMGSVGDSAYDIQRSIGGKAHDDALQAAVEEGKEHFHQCSRCGKWVCPEVCWNAAANQCEECAPDFREEMAASHAQAKASAARDQLYDKARSTNYVADVDMSAESFSSAKPRERETKLSTVGCEGCGADVGNSKFCPECGKPVKRSRACGECGHVIEGAAKFCPECGGKVV